MKSRTQTPSSTTRPSSGSSGRSRDDGKADLGIIFLVAGLVVLALVGFGALNVNWPWDSVELADDEKKVIVVQQPEIYAIEAINLDCRARVRAQVPVVGIKEHRALGQVYRTDKVNMSAVGDVDTCVESSGVEITQGFGTQTHTVVIPASAIRFERPRVDAPATQDSVEFDKGAVGKVTDAFPWVADSEGLTPAAYTFAQGVIGSSQCMREAYDVTSELIVEAYRQQMIDQGGDPDLVDVTIEGEPDFYQNRDELTTLDDFEFTTNEAAIDCEVTDPTAGGALSATEEADGN